MATLPIFAQLTREQTLWQATRGGGSVGCKLCPDSRQETLASAAFASPGTVPTFDAGFEIRYARQRRGGIMAAEYRRPPERWDASRCRRGLIAVPAVRQSRC